jgi:hypothetical protein
MSIPNDPIEDVVNAAFSFGGWPFGSWPEPPDTVPLRILGLDVLPAARDEVKTAFRVKMLAAHPDIRPDSEAADANTGVRELMWARDVLMRKIPAVSAPTCVTPTGVGDVATTSSILSFAVTTNVAPHTPGDGSRNSPLPRPRCENCGSEEWLREYGRWSGYCAECAEKLDLARRRDLRRQARAGRVCENEDCCVTFTPKRADGRFCSGRCRQAAYRKRIAAAKAARAVLASSFEG